MIRSYFWIFLFVTLFFSGFGALPLLTFSPYVTYSLLHAPLKSTLWRALLAGLIFDVFHSTTPFGIVPLSSCMSALILFKKREFFYSDKFFSLPLFNFWFSFIFTIFQALAVHIFRHSLVISLKSLTSELLLMPIIDSIYGLILFYLPIALINHIKNKRLLKA